MLIELKNTRQIKGESYRRWFSGNHMELIVWYSDDRKNIKGFQLCYRKDQEEKAITWHQNYGYSHTTCDNGEGNAGQYKMTPILIPNGPFHNQIVFELFRENSQQLEQKMVEFISNKIIECPLNI